MVAADVTPGERSQALSLLHHAYSQFQDSATAERSARSVETLAYQQAGSRVLWEMSIKYHHSSLMAQIQQRQMAAAYPYSMASQGMQPTMPFAYQKQQHEQQAVTQTHAVTMTQGVKQQQPQAVAPAAAQQPAPASWVAAAPPPFQQQPVAAPPVAVQQQPGPGSSSRDEFHKLQVWARQAILNDAKRIVDAVAKKAGEGQVPSDSTKLLIRAITLIELDDLGGGELSDGQVQKFKQMLNHAENLVSRMRQESNKRKSVGDAAQQQQQPPAEDAGVLFDVKIAAAVQPVAAPVNVVSQAVQQPPLQLLQLDVNIKEEVKKVEAPSEPGTQKLVRMLGSWRSPPPGVAALFSRLQEERRKAGKSDAFPLPELRAIGCKSAVSVL